MYSCADIFFFIISHHKNALRLLIPRHSRRDESHNSKQSFYVRERWRVERQSIREKLWAWDDLWAEYQKLRWLHSRGGFKTSFKPFRAAKVCSDTRKVSFACSQLRSILRAANLFVSTSTWGAIQRRVFPLNILKLSRWAMIYGRIIVIFADLLRWIYESLIPNLG